MAPKEMRRTWYHLKVLFLTPSFASATRFTASTFSSWVRKRASTGESGKKNHKTAETQVRKKDSAVYPHATTCILTADAHTAEDEENVLPEVNLWILDVSDLAQMSITCQECMVGINAYAVGNEAAEDARPPVERVPDERAERDLFLRIPDRGQDEHAGRDDRFEHAEEEPNSISQRE